MVVRDDVVSGRGAPGGVVTALTRAATRWVLIVCCDMPHVGPEAISALCARADGDVTLFEAQPFPALYRAALAGQWRAKLESSVSMSALLSTVSCARVSLQGLDPRIVRSVNTAEDARSLGVEIPGSLC